MDSLPKENASELGGSIYIIRLVQLGIDWAAFQKVQCPCFFVPVKTSLVPEATSPFGLVISQCFLVVTMSKQQRDQCIYCGNEQNITSDHVPPRCLFSKPRPHLITVPACAECNNAAKLDDEYFRIVVSAGVQDNLEGQKVWREGAIRTLKRSEKLRKHLLNNTRAVDIVTPAGVIVGTSHAFKAENKRIKRVVIRIVRGLLWHHYKVKTDDQTAFDLYVDADVTSIIETLQLTSVSSIGGTAFQYRHSTAEDDPGSSLWWLRFYQNRHFVVIISGKLALEAEKKLRGVEAARVQSKGN